jgi:hypothetical protein
MAYPGANLCVVSAKDNAVTHSVFSNESFLGMHERQWTKCLEFCLFLQVDQSQREDGCSGSTIASVTAPLAEQESIC